MHKILIPFLVSLITVLFKPPFITQTKVTVSSSAVGPFEEFDKNQVITFDYLYEGANDTLYEQFKVYNYGTNDLLYKNVLKMHDVSNKTYWTFSVPLNLREMLSNDGLLLELKIFGVSDLLFSKTIDLFPIQHSVIDVKNGDNDRVVSQTVAFQLFNNEVLRYFDDFNFVNFDDYVNAENYYTLDFNGSTFLYNSKLLKYDSASISIVDEKRILKNFFHDNKGIINLPMLIVDNGEEKEFKYKNKFYVDRLNLETADYQLPNFVQTERLYLPLNKKDDFLGTQIVLSIKGAGYNKYDINLFLTYDVVRGLLGDCNNSDYCIIGEVE